MYHRYHHGIQSQLLLLFATIHGCGYYRCVHRPLAWLVFLSLSHLSLSLFLATSSFSSFFTSSGFSSFVVLMLWLVFVELLQLLQLSMLCCFYALERGLFFDCNMSLPYYTLCWPLSLITTAARRITIILIIRYLILYAYLLIHIYINIFWFCFVLLCFVFL